MTVAATATAVQDFLARSDDHLRASIAFGIAGVVLGYDEPLAHLIQAGGDAIVIPSRFEPCGLNQMYGLAYGTPPVVRKITPSSVGLNSTVRPCLAAIASIVSLARYEYGEEKSNQNSIAAGIARNGAGSRVPSQRNSSCQCAGRPPTLPPQLITGGDSFC